jgi:hypothetical protein
MKVEIKIQPFDKLADSAKDFLQKVITPPLEELGLLAADKIKLWRFENQVNILNKAESYLKEKGLKTRKVSLKVMTPLLEESAMEEDATLQEKWAALIANTVREGSDLDTTLYSHILSQMTRADADLFGLIFKVCTQYEKHSTSSITIHSGSTVNIKDLRKSNDINIQIDNLIRLRLIKEMAAYGIQSNVVGLTELGFRFMQTVRII